MLLYTKKSYNFTVQYPCVKFAGSYQELTGTFTNETCFAACQADARCLISVTNGTRCAFYASVTETGVSYERAAGFYVTTFAQVDMRKYTLVAYLPSYACRQLGSGLSAAQCFARCLADTDCMASYVAPVAAGGNCSLYDFSVVVNASAPGAALVTFDFISATATDFRAYGNVALAPAYSTLSPTQSLDLCQKFCARDSARCVACAISAGACELYERSAALTKSPGSVVFVSTSVNFTVQYPGLLATGAFANQTDTFTDETCFDACQADPQCLFSATDGAVCSFYASAGNVEYRRSASAGFTVTSYASVDFRKYTSSSLRPSQPYKSYSARSELECLALCLQDPVCVAVSGPTVCALYDATVVYSASSTGFFYYVPPSKINSLLYQNVLLTDSTFTADAATTDPAACYLKCATDAQARCIASAVDASGCRMYTRAATLTKSVGKQLLVSSAFAFLVQYPNLLLSDPLSTQAGATSDAACFDACQANAQCLYSFADPAAGCKLYGPGVAYERVSGYKVNAYALADLRKYTVVAYKPASAYRSLGLGYTGLFCFGQCLADPSCVASFNDASAGCSLHTASLLANTTTSTTATFDYVPSLAAETAVFPNVQLSPSYLNVSTTSASPSQCFLSCSSQPTARCIAFTVATGVCLLYDRSATIAKVVGSTVFALKSFPFTVKYPSLQFMGAFTTQTGGFSDETCFEACQADSQCLVSSAVPGVSCSFIGAVNASGVGYKRATGFNAFTYTLNSLLKYSSAYLRPSSLPYTTQTGTALSDADCLGLCLQDALCVAFYRPAGDCNFYQSSVTYAAVSTNSFFFVPPSIVQPVVYENVLLGNSYTTATGLPAPLTPDRCFAACASAAPGTCIASSIVSNTCKLYSTAATVTSKQAGSSVYVLSTYKFVTTFKAILSGDATFDYPNDDAECFNMCQADPTCLASTKQDDTCYMFDVLNDATFTSSCDDSYTAYTYTLLYASKFTCPNPIGINTN